MTIFTMKGGKIEPIAIVKGGKTIDVRRLLKAAAAAAPAAQPAAAPAPATGRAATPRARGGAEEVSGSVQASPTKTAPRAVPFSCLAPRIRERRGPFGRLPRDVRSQIDRPCDTLGAGDAGMDIFLQQIINGLTLGSVYAVVALGYTMVYGIIQLINFAHGEVVMIGAWSRSR